MKIAYFNFSKIFKPQCLIGQQNFYRITLDWKHQDIYVDMLIPGYVKKVLQKFQHQPPESPHFHHFLPLNTSKLSREKFNMHHLCILFSVLVFISMIVTVTSLNSVVFMAMIVYDIYSLCYIYII